MKFIDLSIKVPADELVGIMSKNDVVNDGVEFDKDKGIPHMHVTRSGSTVKIKCKLTGTATRDNGSIVGTYFKGRLTESRGVTRLKGVIVTSPLYHLIFFALIAVFVYKCISLGAISVLPICLIAVSYFLFRGEYRKQNIIRNYIYRAFRKTYSLKYKQYNKDQSNAKEY